jgi:chromosome segregation ATPase
MKAACFALTVAALCVQADAGTTASPVSKVLGLLGDLQAKITAEGEAAKKAFQEYTDWCEERTANVGFEIKTGKSEVAELKASIENEVATSSSLSASIEDLSAKIAAAEADLKAAVSIRAKEAADFGSEEAELGEVIDTLDRAVGILQREMQKGGAAMMQLKSAGNLVQALTTMVQASMISAADSKRLTALVQSSQATDDSSDDDALGAPAAAVYEGHSGSIIDTLEDLSAKAQSQLSDARSRETSALHNFQMLKQSLEDELKFASKDMDSAKKGLAASGGKKATAEGDLAVTEKELAEDVSTLSTLKQDCMTKAQDYEAATKSRAEELKALAAAKQVIADSTGGAAAVAYGLNQVSLLQLTRSRLSSGVDLANYEAVRFVRELGRKQQDPALTQLASRMASAMRLSSGSDQDPFAKVKGLIADMITKLEDAASADSSHKAYCDKELAESSAKKDEKTTDIEKLSTKIDQMSARSAQLKEQVATLQKSLADLAASQAEMTKLRQEEHAVFTKEKADTEQGLEGVKMALKILREYYAQEDKAHSAAEGAATGIVGLLEVVESDFSKGLAEMTAAEDSAAASYDAGTKANEINKATKEKDVEYKSKEATGLDKSVAESTSDRSGVQAELDAVNEYLLKLEDMCISKPDTYGERKRRREAELAGLKEALQILEGEAVLLQQKTRMLRGIRVHTKA